MLKKVIIIGAGGHGKVIADIIEKSGDEVFGFLDDNSDKSEVIGYPVLGKITECYKFTDKLFFIAIGNNTARKSIVSKYPMLKFYTAIHPTAIISREVKIDVGTCVMAGAIINASTVIGKHCIINSSAIVEHDNYLSDYVHISPKATLCGTVSVGEETHIGAGAIIKNNISICNNCIIGAGAVVVKDISSVGIYKGVPAK